MRKFGLALLGICSAACAQPPPGFGGQERLQHYIHRTYSWQRTTILAGETTFDYLLDRDARSFEQRFSSALGRRVVRNSIELALGAMLDEDARFGPSQQRGFRNRLRFALLQTVRSREDRFAYSRLGATAGAALLASRWRRHRTSAAVVLQDVGSGYLSDLQNSLLNEFGDDLKSWGLRLRRRVFGR